MAIISTPEPAVKEISAPRKMGMDILHDPMLNHGTAFSKEERRHLKILGLLPPHVSTPEQQVHRALRHVRQRTDDLDKYIEMISLMDRNETLFYRVVVDN